MALLRRIFLVMRDTLSGQERTELERAYAILQQEHNDLDAAIHALQRLNSPDQLQMQRLKKRKLLLKDKMTQIANSLHPDIIA